MRLEHGVTISYNLIRPQLCKHTTSRLRRHLCNNHVVMQQEMNARGKHEHKDGVEVPHPGSQCKTLHTAAQPDPLGPQHCATSVIPFNIISDKSTD